MVEFAFVLPIFLLIVMATVDFGWALRTYISTTNAAREGARFAIVQDGLSDPRPAIKDHTASRSGNSVTSANVKVCWKNAAGTTYCDSGMTATDNAAIVEAKTEYKFITPLGGLVKVLTGGTIKDKIDMTSRTAMFIE
jgi:Flp pilus assembly protein TadG